MGWRTRKPVSVSRRTALHLVLLSTFALSLAHPLNLLPNAKQTEMRRKAVVCELLAITSSLLAQRHERQLIEENVRATVKRYPEIKSACVRRPGGDVICQIGDHQKHWSLKENAQSTRHNIYVPINKGKERWATVELSFERDTGLFTLMAEHPLIVLAMLSVCVNGLLFGWYLKRAFSYLDPSRSVPSHVRATLDTFSEGVVVLDSHKRIVLANDKFRQHLAQSDEELLGRGIDEFPWQDEEPSEACRWENAERSTYGIRLGLQQEHERHTYLVNASQIRDDDDKRKGTIVSFDDITPLEDKRKELAAMLRDLQSSRAELSERNKELQDLATRDPLTGCFNRRTFFESFEKHWVATPGEGQSLSCFMVDVDHFKSVNDNHGHSVGDEVLILVSEQLQAGARKTDVVCRYGGEEFCILLPETEMDEAEPIAEQLRAAIENLEIDGLSVTASLGLSSNRHGAADPQELLDQADQCLYVAKRTGRNRVVRWDQMPAESTNRPTENMVPAAETGDDDVTIPYPAVASLVSALAYRDADTAAHSTRVAELCVATASGMLSVKDTYVLEVAALLHDIGKVGVPDAILLKPEQLTAKEWEVMELHARIGVEIVEASFSNQQLVDIVRYHHAHYGGRGDKRNFPIGQDIPIGARIVSIADAYDAMVTDRVYRKGRTPEAAFQELRRCAGHQFDPELVERFIGIVQEYTSTPLLVESKQTALQIGLQIENLARAIDDEDCTGIKALAARLESTAARGGIREIESVAGNIKEVANEVDEFLPLLEMVDQLLVLCRAAQKVYADTRFVTP